MEFMDAFFSRGLERSYLGDRSLRVRFGGVLFVEVPALPAKSASGVFAGTNNLACLSTILASNCHRISCSLQMTPKVFLKIPCPEDCSKLQKSLEGIVV